MSKKKKKKHLAPDATLHDAGKGGEAALSVEKEGITPAGWKTIAGGVGLLLLGFATLSLTDPEGRNWASSLCPFLILGGYAVIALGIFLPESSPEKVPEDGAASAAPSGTPVDPTKTTS